MKKVFLLGDDDLQNLVDRTFERSKEKATPDVSYEGPIYLTLKGAAHFFNVTIQTIHNWRRSGKLKGFKKIGGRVYISQADCMKSMEDWEKEDTRS